MDTRTEILTEKMNDLARQTNSLSENEKSQILQNFQRAWKNGDKESAERLSEMATQKNNLGIVAKGFTEALSKLDKLPSDIEKTKIMAKFNETMTQGKSGATRG